jgi:hypothetical protein
VTEVADGLVVPYSQNPSVAQPSVLDLRTLSGSALAEKFLTTLGETPVRNAEVVVFDQARDGFNLSVTADLLVRKEDKRLIFQTKGLPEQFVQILRKSGTEVITIGDRDQGRPFFEAVLQGLGLPCSFGYFSFRIPEKSNHPRLTASFSSLRTMNDGKPIYLIDFDPPPSGLPFLGGHGEGRVIRY